MTIQIDKYTKGVLTIIAIALMIIALKGTGLFPKAFAHDGGVHKIAICSANGVRCADIAFSGALWVTN